MQVSCAFPTALDSPENIALAERLGYARAWVYDTPQQSPDVWMTLALAAAAAAAARGEVPVGRPILRGRTGRGAQAASTCWQASARTVSSRRSRMIRRTDGAMSATASQASSRTRNGC